MTSKKQDIKIINSFVQKKNNRGAKQESLKKKQQSMQQTANRNHQQSSSTPTKLSMKPKLTHLNRGLVALVRK